VLPPCKRLSMLGSTRLNLTLGFSKASGPGSAATRASSNECRRQEPSSSRPTLSSSTALTVYAVPSKPNNATHIAPAPSPRTLRPHRRSCSGGASGVPTSCRPRLRFLRDQSSKPNTTFVAPGAPRKSREHRRFRSLSERITMPNRARLDWQWPRAFVYPDPPLMAFRHKVVLGRLDAEGGFVRLPAGRCRGEGIAAADR
jgi:hypothetical protein